MSNFPFISIIIPTCYRQDMLMECVGSIMVQNYPEFEIIVIDQAADSKIKELLNARYPGNPRIHYLLALQAGAARARNLGVSRARGPVVAFIDDDALADSTWLRGVALAFSRSPAPALMAGRILPIWESIRPTWYPPEREFLLGLYDLGLQGQTLPETHMPIGANMAGLRDVVIEYHGFDERLGPNYFRGRKMVTGEEAILGRRIRGAGHVAVYEPMALVHHRISRNKLRRSYFLKRHFWEGVTIAEQMALLSQIGSSKWWHYRHHWREICMAAARSALPGYRHNYDASNPVVRMEALSSVAYSSGVIYGLASLGRSRNTVKTRCESA